MGGQEWGLPPPAFKDVPQLFPPSPSYSSLPTPLPTASRSWVHSVWGSMALLEVVPRSVGIAPPFPCHLASSTGLISENKRSWFPEAKQAFDFYELRLLCRNVVLCLTVIASYKVTNK